MDHTTMLDTLKQKVTRFFRVNQTYKEIEKDKDKLNKEVKQGLADLGLSTIETDDVVAKLTYQDRSKMNEDRLVQKLKDLGLQEAIILVEKPNQQVIETLIFEGRLPAAELESCLDKSTVQVLKVTAKKVKK